MSTLFVGQHVWDQALGRWRQSVVAHIDLRPNGSALYSTTNGADHASGITRQMIHTEEEHAMLAVMGDLDDSVVAAAPVGTCVAMPTAPEEIGRLIDTLQE